MPERRALVLGGTGMLAGVVGWLAGQGWHVVVPSRRYSPIPVDEIEDDSGKVLWVEARWERPARLARDARRALGGEADLLVSWVHAGYRFAVLEAVEELLADKAPIVDVHGGEAVRGPMSTMPESALPGHPTQRVVLGHVKEGASTRSLTHAEIVDGVLTGVQWALEGQPLALHQVGELR